jgi:hypoxanthine phosphoribosyltransferase
MNFQKISWEQLENDCIMLAKQIDGTKIDEIISISRGGMVVSRLLSDLLKLPISHIAIDSYANLHMEKEPIITQLSPREFNGERVLLVDDLSDSGKTFLRGLSYLKELPIAKVFTASLYYKSHAQYIPDFTMQKIDAWIVFPYEIRETREDIIKSLGKKEGLKKLKELNVSDW